MNSNAVFVLLSLIGMTIGSLIYVSTSERPNVWYLRTYGDDVYGFAYSAEIVKDGAMLAVHCAEKELEISFFSEKDNVFQKGERRSPLVLIDNRRLIWHGQAASGRSITFPIQRSVVELMQRSSSFAIYDKVFPLDTGREQLIKLENSCFSR
ncbi:MAG: hypothetical protein KIT15_12345 [Xanthobacteraceae bacterium]|nr:hypothetical protein [Xanthobacteraceae bacterium]MCW5675358.1 hypothetical protein [Xanthobacteraceae bacterium]MCW5676599.1 hypothetical protein [Xanthobacteraceae bacterium]